MFGSAPHFSSFWPRCRIGFEPCTMKASNGFDRPTHDCAMHPLGRLLLSPTSRPTACLQVNPLRAKCFRAIERFQSFHEPGFNINRLPMVILRRNTTCSQLRSREPVRASSKSSLARSIPATMDFFSGICDADNQTSYEMHGFFGHRWGVRGVHT